MLGLRALVIFGFLFQYKNLPWLTRYEEFKKSKPGLVILNRYLGGGLILLAGFIAFTYLDYDRNRNLSHYRTSTVGEVTYSGTTRGKSSFCVTFYDSKKEKYYGCASVTRQEADAIHKGQLYRIEYSYNNPDFNEIIIEKPIVPAGDSIVQRLGKVLEIIKGEDYLSIFYRFYFKSYPTFGVRFAPLTTKINVGEEYYVEFPLEHPEKGVFNLNKKLDIEKLIESAKGFNTENLPFEPTRDTIINGMHYQIID